MATVAPSRRHRLPLVALAVALLALILLLSRVGGEGAGLACVPVAPAQEAVRPPSDVEAAELRSGVALTSEPAVAEPTTHERSTPAAKKDAESSVSGRVIDRETRDPVPYVVVRLECGGAHDLVESDASGAFASEKGFRSGTLRASVLDAEVAIESFQIEHDGAIGSHEWILDVPIGPTYPIASIDGHPIAGSQWTAELFETTLPEGLAGEIEVRPGALDIIEPASSAPDRKWTRIAVRDGPIPFARWPKHEHEFDPRYRALLVLRSVPLLRRADQNVFTTVGIHRALAPMSRPSSIVEGKLDLRGSAEQPVRVVLFSPRSERNTGTFVAEVDAQGSDYLFEDVPTGTWSIVAWGPNALSEVQQVRVQRGDRYMPKPLRVDISQSSRRDAWRWRDSQDELLAFADAEQLLVVAPRRALGTTRALVARADAPSAAFFAYEDIGRNGVDVRVVGLGTGSVFPHDLRGTSSIVGRIDRSDLDPSKQERFRVDAYVGGSAERIGAAVTFGPAGSMLTTKPLGDDGSFLAARRARFSWAAWAPGCAPVFGDEGDFKSAREHTNVAEARMRVGWGAQLSLRAGDPAQIEKQPWPWRVDGGIQDRVVLAALAGPVLSGIKVTVDGARGAESDENGDVKLATGVMPVRLGVHAKGLRLCALERLPGSGLRYVAWMKPAP